MADYRTIQFAIKMINCSKSGVEELAAKDAENDDYAKGYHSGFIAGLESALQSIDRYGPVVEEEPVAAGERPYNDEVDRINELEMWGDQGRPAWPPR